LQAFKANAASVGLEPARRPADGVRDQRVSIQRNEGGEGQIDVSPWS
jgi:hypothetical protein